ncbi:unnamed protein product [Clavelina lepadiformis]|uniref:Uncharacterized protein n=2 Tax=Clavelina lepadiformis TaxID=159417 RepID=A0ABP0FD97_CLALP
MSKSAVDHFTKIAAVGDKFNQLYIPYNPAFMKTNILQSWFEGGEKVDDVAERGTKLVPLSRKNVMADDVTDAIMFLASDRAKMITGICLFVDGARHLTGI